MKVWVATSHEVNIDPLNIVKDINVLPDGGEWIKIEDGQPVIYEEISAGSHSFDKKIRVLTDEEYKVYLAKETLINFLKSKKSR